jgi:hypothetical protein
MLHILHLSPMGWSWMSCSFLPSLKTLLRGLDLQVKLNVSYRIGAMLFYVLIIFSDLF